MATEVMESTVLRAYEHGVSIVAGSDAGMPLVRHGEISYEIVQLAKCGLPNLEALAAGTSVAAEALGLGTEVGRVKPGFAADLILVDGDPSKDLSVLQSPMSIQAVVRSGRVLVVSLAESPSESVGALMRM